ncbi:MAG: CapA family protein [Peptostreptococcaceae bacterium]|nr:CapA family protein [Peptostreptococcaceae bacterium]
MSRLNLTRPYIIKKVIVPVIIGLLVVGALMVIPLLFNGSNHPGNELNSGLEQEEEKPAEKPVNLEIVCVGDIMVHEPQLASQYNAETGTYDYNNNFKYVKKYIDQADLAIGNFEGTFGGKPYSGYPAFSTPDELAAALKNTGFDVAITANNHMVDTGNSGVIRTLEVLREAGMTTSGSRMDPNEPRYSINNVNGVNVGIVSYTYESSGSGTDVAINGNYISAETAQLINSFSYNSLDADLEKIKIVVDDAKNEGADLIVLYLHWGEEYQQVPNKWQEQIVKSAVEEMNVDIIFASHTHVIQKMEMVKSETTGKNVPVFYSMGNFISNQREETVQNRYTEQGMIARVELEYMVSTKELIFVKMSYTPTWVDKYKRNGKTVYEVIPLDAEMETNPALIESGHLLKAKQALEDINGILKIN